MLILQRQLLICCLILCSCMCLKAKARLACQPKAVAVRMGTTSIPLTTTTLLTTNAFPKILRKSLSNQPNLCCSSKPFNSNMGICCMGKLINKAKTKCCLDGTTVPKDSRCLCDPDSEWLRSEQERLITLEQKYASLVEECDVFNENLLQKIGSIEEKLEFLDSRANAFFRDFLEEINIARHEDPAEVDYIINMVLFLNQNEENIDSARRSLTALEDATIHLLDNETSLLADEQVSEATNNITRQNEGLNSSTLRDIRREIQALNTSVDTADALLNLARQEIEIILPATDNKDKIKRLILEWNKIMQEIKLQTKVLQTLKNQEIHIANAMLVSEADRGLLSNMMDILEYLMDQVLSMEAASEEEHYEMMEDKVLENEYDNEYIEEEEYDDDYSVFVRRRRNIEESESIVETRNKVRFFNLQPPPETKKPSVPLLSESRTSGQNTKPKQEESYFEATELVTSSAQTTKVRVKPTTRTIAITKKCDFSAWKYFISNFARRAKLAVLDLRDMEEMGENDGSNALSEDFEEESIEMSRMEADFMKNGHGVNANVDPEIISKRRKRNIHNIKSYLNQYRNLVDDEDSSYSNDFYKNPSLTFLEHLKNFQLSETFMKHITQLITYTTSKGAVYAM